MLVQTIIIIGKMQPKINYHYSVPFKEETFFTWYNAPIDLTSYKDKIIPKLPWIIDKLNNAYNDRQAVIVVNSEESFMSCLLTIQFQNIDGLLYLIANYRSQCKIYGRPNDCLMLQYIATKVMNELNLKRYKIYVNVGNYHENYNLVPADPSMP